jgi:hypothetical protein
VASKEIIYLTGIRIGFIGTQRGRMLRGTFNLVEFSTGASVEEAEIGPLAIFIEVQEIIGTDIPNII